MAEKEKKADPWKKIEEVFAANTELEPEARKTLIEKVKENIQKKHALLQTGFEVPQVVDEKQSRERFNTAMQEACSLFDQRDAIKACVDAMSIPEPEPYSAPPQTPQASGTRPPVNER